MTKQEALRANVEADRLALETFMGKDFKVDDLDPLPETGERVLLTGVFGNQECAYIVEDRLIVDEYVPELAAASIDAGADPAEARLKFDEVGEVVE